MKSSPEIKSAGQAMKLQKKLSKRWSDETELSQSILIYCATLLEQILERYPTRRKRPRTGWQTFLSIQMKTGKSVQEAAKLWREQKIGRVT